MAVLLFSLLMYCVTWTECISLGSGHNTLQKIFYTSRCPKETFLILNSKMCVDRCPSHMVAIGSICHMRRQQNNIRNPRVPKIKRDNSGILYSFCDPGQCKQQRPFCYKLQCWETCPMDTYIYNNSCIDSCLPSQFISDRSCVFNCPRIRPLTFRNECVAKCPLHLYLQNTTCVKKCTGDFYIHERTCNSSCPQNAPFVLYKGSERHCYRQCPEYTVTSNHTCKTHCPFHSRFFQNGTCYSKCPPNFPLKMMIQTPYSNIATCVQACPSDRVRDENACDMSCSYGKKLYKGTCLADCPKSVPFAVPNNLISVLPHVQQSFFCSKECPDFTSSDNFICMQKCSPVRPYTFNKTCLTSCPNDTYIQKYFHLTLCVPACPSLHYGRHCVQVCPPYNFLYENSCVSTCPKNLKYNNKECVEKCPNSQAFLLNSTCVTSCPYHLKYFERQCIEHCPETYPYTKVRSIYNSNKIFECTKTCPLYQPLVHKLTCVSHCPSDYFIQNSSCVQTCPFPFFVYTNQSIKLTLSFMKTIHPRYCMKMCPSNTVTDVYSNHCLTKCPSVNLIIDNKCYNRTKCPQSFPYIETTPIGRNCTDKCHGKNSLYNKTTCLPLCPFNEQDKDTCSKACPPLLYRNELNLDCVKACPSGTITSVSDMRCVMKCPATYLLISGQCFNLTQCPPELPYIENTNVGRNCTKTCHGKNYIYDEERCMPLCQFTHNDKNPCAKSCPDHLYLESAYDKTCVEDCGNEKVAKDGVCVYLYECDTIVEKNICTHRNKCRSHYFRQNVNSKLICFSFPFVKMLCTSIAIQIVLGVVFWLTICNGRRNLHDLYKKIALGENNVLLTEDRQESENYSFVDENASENTAGEARTFERRELHINVNELESTDDVALLTNSEIETLPLV